MFYHKQSGSGRSRLELKTAEAQEANRKTQLSFDFAVEASLRRRFSMRRMPRVLCKRS